MEGGLQVISREILVLPSQTPPHPTNVKLTYIDKLMYNFFIPLIFFYNPDDESRSFNTSQISERLKNSLLHVLPSFYPLAGRLISNRSIDCNDAGVEFLVARARARLDDVTGLDCTHLSQFLPGFKQTKPQQPLLAVQITFLDCGGIIVASSISHAVADLASAMEFLKAWASACRGETHIRPELSFGTASYFPSLGFLPLVWFQRMLLPDENFETRRLVFDKEKLDILRQIATSHPGSDVKDPTRVELVSAFIWKQFLGARYVNGKSRKMQMAMHTVNLRSKTTPSGILENVFGNCIMLSSALVPQYASDEDLRLHGLVGMIRRSIRRVRDGYITKPMSKESFMKDFLKLSALFLVGKLESCFFSSWRGFPVYELNFGWGSPIKFTSTFRPMKNMVVLVSSKSGDDMEVLVTMMPDDLQIIDSQIKLITPRLE